MANTKISALTPNMNPSGSEEMVYALNGTNGKITLDTMKTYITPDLSQYATLSDLSGYATTASVAAKQDLLISGTNIKTINGNSILGMGNLDTSSSYSEYNYSTMQGPCQSGYHVPSQIEWQGLYNVCIALGLHTDNADFSKYLKIPYAGYRSRSNGTISNQGTGGLLWSCEQSSGCTLGIIISDTHVYVDSYGSGRPAEGRALRGFKDEPVIPDSTWTTLFDGSLIADGAGIFWDSTNGYISISADGASWITIADKNVGATVAWSYGNALSATNCGNYFQRGNNYGFDGIGGSVTTSNVQVDASSYGPGNYYSSSTFITQHYDWALVENDDLWGGVTGPTTTQYDMYNRLQLSGTTITIGGNYIGGITGDILSGSYSLVSGNNAHVGREHYLFIPTQTNSYSITLGSGVSNPFNLTLPSSTTKSCLIKFYCDSVSSMVISDCKIAS